MNQNETPRVGGRCSVWECDKAVLTSSLCSKHLANNPIPQDGTAPPGSDASNRPSGSRTRHTARRTKGFSVRRSGGGPVPVRLESPQKPTDSQNSTSFVLANVKDGCTPGEGLPDNHDERRTSPTSGQAASQLPKPTKAESFFMNTLIFNHNPQTDSFTSSTIQKPLSNGDLNILRANGDGSSANPYVLRQDNLESHVSKTIHGPEGPTLSNKTNDHTVISSCLDSVNTKLSRPPEELSHSVPTNLHELETSVRVEHVHFVEVRSDVLLETPGKRRRDSTDPQKPGPLSDFPQEPTRRTQVENPYTVPHPSDRTNVAISNSPRKRMLASVAPKRRESSIPISKLISAENVSPKMTRTSRQMGSPEKGTKKLEKSAAGRGARQLSEPNLTSSRGASITPTMETMGSRESNSWRVSEDQIHTRAVFAVDFFPHASSSHSSNSLQNQPVLATRISSDGLSSMGLSKRSTMAPTTPTKDISMVNKVKPPSRMTAEERRRARVLNFDSAAFDAMIYAQAGTRPPQGVVVPTNLRPKTPMSSNDDQRLYLHANPSIHLLHNRSEEWHREKALEIQARGGRKAWFGKAVERERWLRAKEKAEEEKQNQASAAGAIPMRPEPQPWTYDRIMDFGDVAPEDLPEDVLQNPAWVKACAWHRENQAKNALRQRVAKNRHQQAWDHLRNLIGDAQGTSKKRHP